MGERSPQHNFLINVAQQRPFACQHMTDVQQLLPQVVSALDTDKILVGPLSRCETSEKKEQLRGSQPSVQGSRSSDHTSTDPKQCGQKYIG